MNKQELIKKYKELENGTFDIGALVACQSILKDLEQLDEPQKVVIPQFVEDWIKYCKNTNVTMTRALLVGEVDFYNYANQKDFSRLKEFLETESNQEIFARAWLDGYTIKKDKRYLVKVKGLGHEFRVLKYNIFYNDWFTGSERGDSSFRLHHTRKELEEAGFGWVFDCPGIEVEEVTE